MNKDEGVISTLRLLEKQLSGYNSIQSCVLLVKLEAEG
ncbi:hypothetical protein FB550_107243 [Neobacillus bataviensis]|uniref:Uncharacterized protein n=1 Tax=Neobacillus bataviensis TaxID=220685 RepID=A0A561D8L1_9BACI|nr:hypothetical protein FB550_107243 [Neobacillus bataviensis]